MKQYSRKDMQKILDRNGFRLFRTKGSHQIWKRDDQTITLPCVRLRSVIALRIIKENGLVE